MLSKKILAVAVAGAMLAPLAAQAEINVKGEVRYRFAQTTDVNAEKDKTLQPHNSRGRISFDGKAAGGVKAFVQIEANDLTNVSETNSDKVSINYNNISCAEGKTSSKPNTDGSYDVNNNCSTASASSTGEFTDDNGGTVQVEQAWVAIPMGPVTVKAGQQKAKWGTGFKVDGAKVNNRVAISTKINNFTFAALADEGATPNKKNYRSNGVLAKGDFGAVKAGVIHKPIKDKAWTDVYVTGSISGLGFAVENSQQQNDTADDMVGTLIQLTYDFGAATAILANVTTADGFMADDDFSPVSTLGGDHPTNYTRIGSLGDWNATLFGATGKVDSLSWTVMMGSAEIVDTGTASKTGVSVADLRLGYEIAKGTTASFSYGNLGDDLDYEAMGLELKTKF